MAVTITTNTLSSRVRYLNVSASTANADAKDVVLAMANALIDLGWSRYDTAGATAVVGTDDNAGVILRRACYDNAQSGHFNYLGLRLVGTTNNTYTFYLTQAADWSSTTSMSAFVAGAASSQWASNVTGRTNLLDFTQGGTIWLFDGGKTLLIASQSGATLTKTDTAIWMVGEYKKEFGENVNAATGYIHNGVLTSSSWLLGASGQNSLARGHLGVTSAQAYSFSTSGSSQAFIGDWHGTVRLNSSNSGQTGQWNMGFATGSYGPQFILTEAPTAAAPAGVFSNSPSVPAACTGSFSTRMSMGYLGYLGYVTPYYSVSVNSVLGIPDATAGSVFNGAVPLPFSTYNSTSQFTISSYLQEYANNNLAGGLKFNIFEPILSTGTTSALNNTANASYFSGAAAIGSPNTGTYTGPQYKFSMLGRPFDIKIFGPYTSEKYSFLDAITIPCDADGFYADGGTNKDFWLIPSGVNVAYVMPK
jgi:hypothetical protein